MLAQLPQVTPPTGPADFRRVARYANRVAMWDGGRIQMHGTPEAVLTDSEVRRVVTGQ
jgi:ABC-type hemin transport system ATPase subunit